MTRASRIRNQKTKRARNSRKTHPKMASRAKRPKARPWKRSTPARLTIWTEKRPMSPSMLMSIWTLMMSPRTWMTAPSHCARISAMATNQTGSNTLLSPKPMMKSRKRWICAIRRSWAACALISITSWKACRVPSQSSPTSCNAASWRSKTGPGRSIWKRACSIPPA